MFSTFLELITRGLKEWECHTSSYNSSKILFQKMDRLFVLSYLHIMYTSTASNTYRYIPPSFNHYHTRMSFNSLKQVAFCYKKMCVVLLSFQLSSDLHQMVWHDIQVEQMQPRGLAIEDIVGTLVVMG